MFNLDKKIAVVTGGGSGIGRAISLLFAHQGATVCIVDINEDGGKAVVQEIKAFKGLSTYYYCDISKYGEVHQLINRIILDHKSIDILVNNAGISHIGNVEDTKPEDFERLLNVNVKGIYNCLKAVLPVMKLKGGVILNLASVASTVALSDRFAYSATKGAVVGMTLSVAKDYISNNIRCNCISPGRVHTPFVDGFLESTYPGREQEMFNKLAKTQPIGRMGKPEEIASLVLYLCSDEASFITGSDYPIDGGLIKLST